MALMETVMERFKGTFTSNEGLWGVFSPRQPLRLWGEYFPKVEALEDGRGGHDIPVCDWVLS